ncbi:MAG: YncE family protein [Actinobacteria bacterium]|nr:MAG: YncE family protein [Actinomycetota bacterium]
MRSWRPVRTGPRRRTRRVRVALLLTVALVTVAAAVIAWNRQAGDSPPARASIAPPLAVQQKPKIVQRRLAHAAPLDLYAYDHAGMISGVARRALARVYVPNSAADTVDVIDPHTYKVVDNFQVGALPQHVTPAHDLKTLYVNDDVGNTLTPIDPLTGRPGRPFPVDDPYNLYFTIDGRYAIVVAERLHRLDFRNAHTFRLVRALTVPCADVRASPNAKVFYVADLAAGGVWEVDPARFKVIGFIHTGAGAHGLVVGRSGKVLYVANRNEGSVSVISFRTRKVVAKWHIPGGGSPDMGDVSADGKVLWLSGRYNSEVYAIDTRTGRLIARIPVGASPHGLSVWPQPGRFSLGHTGNMR